MIERDSYRILIADPIVGEGLAVLRGAGPFEVVERPGLTGAALADALVDADAVIVRSATVLSREVLSRADRLQVIGRAGVGVDNIDVEAATELGIAVLNAPSGNTTSAAELTMALLLALARRIPSADRSMRAGEWDRKARGTELYGKTLGLVGAGRIGGEVARRAQAFGMDIVAYDPFLPEDRARALDIELAELGDVLRRGDVVSLHVPLTAITARLIDEERLRTMKRGALLVNAARGGVVDESALIRVLEDGHLAGAALDVYEDEPLPADHPFRHMENVVLTPHLGAATLEAQVNVAVEIAEAVRDALLKADYSRAVNAPALGGEEMRRLRPLLELAERVGLIASSLSDAPMEEVELHYCGPHEEILRPLTAAALIGSLTVVLGRSSVNLVNAIHLAEARGIRIKRVRLGTQGDYAEYVEVRLSGRGRGMRVAGALLAHGFPRIVRIGDFHVDVRPRGSILVLQNRDVPGVIGRIGTKLGEAGVNIAEYHQARLEVGGQALAAVSIDGRLDSAVLDDICAVPEVEWAKQVQLD